LLVMTTAEVGTIRAISATAMATTPAVHPESVLAAVALAAVALAAVALAAVALVVTVLRRTLLRLATPGYECRQAADVLPALIGLLLIRLRLML
jgi:hypothetical protein